MSTKVTEVSRVKAVPPSGRGEVTRVHSLVTYGTISAVAPPGDALLAKS